jgi:hypothetical protein
MTTDVQPSTSSTLTPFVKWAQRKDCIYLTIDVFDVQNENIQLDNNHLSFSGTRKGDNAHFAVDLSFYAPINASASKKCVTDRDISFVLEKETKDDEFWPALVATPSKLIRIDFDKWVDEDAEDETPKPDMGDYSNFDFGNFGGDRDEDDYPLDGAEEPQLDEPIHSSDDDDTEKEAEASHEECHEGCHHEEV